MPPVQFGVGVGVGVGAAAAMIVEVQQGLMLIAFPRRNQRLVPRSEGCIGVGSVRRKRDDKHGGRAFVIGDGFLEHMSTEARHLRSYLRYG